MFTQNFERGALLVALRETDGQETNAKQFVQSLTESEICSQFDSNALVHSRSSGFTAPKQKAKT